jgi:hypothetical protein
MDSAKRRFGTLTLALISLAVALVADFVGAQHETTSTLADKELVIPTTEELINKGPKFAVETAAEVLGLVRGAQRSTTSVNTVEFTGAGTIAEPSANGKWIQYKVTRLVAAFDFVIPAARVDMARSAPGVRAERQIQVVSRKQAWNEEKPGINGTPIAGAADDRVRQIWLTPHGAMRAALMANDLRLANEGGKLALNYSVNGEPVKVVLTAGLLPERVEIQARGSAYGDTLLEATYSQYKDFEGYLFQCPSRMLQKAGGRTILDLTVSNCVVNPYVIFPLPANLARTNTSK